MNGDRRIEQLTAALRTSKGPLMVCTGAGISLASGIPTFRGSDPGAVWTADVTTMGTNRFFEKNPVESWRWYLRRFDKLEAKLPNPAHAALVELERWKRKGDSLRNFILVTQNIDGLHVTAGSRTMVEVHGSARHVRCVRPGCANAAPEGMLDRTSVDLDRFRAAPSEATLPRCPACGALVRPHVLWFDEYYTEHSGYQFAAVLGAAAQMSFLLFVGTPFSVGLTENLLTTARSRGIPVWTIDPSCDAPPEGVLVVREPAEQALPELVRQLQAP